MPATPEQRAKHDALAAFNADIDLQEMRTCKVCHEYKPLSEFYRKQRPVSGYRSRCVSCRDAAIRRSQELATQHAAYYADRAAREAEYEAERQKIRDRIAAGEHPLEVLGWKLIPKEERTQYGLHP